MRPTLTEPNASNVAFVDHHLRPALDSVLQRHLGAPHKVALLDFPLHRNSGDSAIFLGSLNWLRQHGYEIVQVSSLSTYSPVSLRRRLGSDGTILINGGGNFGDLWPHIHRQRELVAADFRDTKVVQLPQSLHFTTDEALSACVAGPLGSHEGFTLLTRDRASERLAREAFGNATVDLAPDMAFGLGCRTITDTATEILWLARDDLERSDIGAVPRDRGIEITDWDMGRMRGPLWRSLATLPKGAKALRSRPFLHALAVGASQPTFEPMARLALDSALATLARGRVVVTDRLHAHILSLLLGRPQVVMDNSYGKISSFMDAWTGTAPGVHAERDTAGALTTARRLLADATPA